MKIGPVESRQFVNSLKKAEISQGDDSVGSRFKTKDSFDISLATKKKIRDLADRKLLESGEIGEANFEDNLEKRNIIKLRISSGYYKNRNVLKQIADKLIKGI